MPSACASVALRSVAVNEVFIEDSQRCGVSPWFAWTQWSGLFLDTSSHSLFDFFDGLVGLGAARGQVNKMGDSFFFQPGLVFFSPGWFLCCLHLALALVFFFLSAWSVFFNLGRSGVFQPRSGFF